jgi:hypothetical protein
MTELTGYSGGTVEEGSSVNNPIVWPKNFVQSTSCGHMIEMNNTPKGERIRLIHGTTKNYIDMDVKANTDIYSHKDIHMLAKESMTLNVGEDPEKHMLVLNIVGDVRMTVEGNTEIECEGDLNTRCDGDYNLTVGGVYSLNTKTSLAFKTDKTFRVESAKYENIGTLYESRHTAREENVKKFHSITQTDPIGAIATYAEGNIRSEAVACRYDKTVGNKFTEVKGKHRENVVGNSYDCIDGGQPEEMVDTPLPNSSYDVSVTGNNSLSTSGNFNISAGGNVNVAGEAIYLN